MCNNLNATAVPVNVFPINGYYDYFTVQKYGGNTKLSSNNLVMPTGPMKIQKYP